MQERPLIDAQGMQLPVEFGTAPSTILYRGKDWKPPVVAPFTLKAKM